MRTVGGGTVGGGGGGDEGGKREGNIIHVYMLLCEPL